MDIPSREPSSSAAEEFTPDTDTGASESGLWLVPYRPDSLPSSPQSSPPLAQLRILAGADDPIPSIEADDGATALVRHESPRERQTTSSTSVVYTPPTTVAPSRSTSPRNHPDGDGERGTDIAETLQDLTLASPGFDMAGISEAIRQVENTPERPPLLLEPGSASPSSRRRRSRSAPLAAVEMHDLKDEEMPSDPFYEAGFQQAFLDAKQLAKEMARALSSSSLHQEPDSTINRLHTEADRLSRFEPPSTRTIAFVGDSGVGKSSLLNALLDSDKLARTSNSGRACTCVATEFRYHNQDDFVVDIQWFSPAETKQQLTDLLQSYREFHSIASDADADDRAASEDGASTAMHTFQALFRGKLQEHRHLVAAPMEEIIREMVAVAQDIRSRNHTGPRTLLRQEDCSTLLTSLTSEQTGHSGSSDWPLIKTISVSLKAHILSKGLVLVDLPGLRDLNLARRNVTERYLLHCDEIFAVCDIGRAITDVGVAEVIALAKRARLSKIGIICTKSDNIRADEAKRDWRGQKAREIQQRIDAVSREKVILGSVKSGLQAYEDLDPEEMFPEERQDQWRLRQRLKETKKRLQQNEFALKQYLIVNRNQMVDRELQDQYREHVPSHSLAIFCVSNVDYWDHRQDPKGEALPYLSLSGILGLRKHCISLVGESQRRIASKYIRDEIAALLSEMSLWVQAGGGSLAAEQKQAIRETLNNLDARLTRNLTGRSSTPSRIAADASRELSNQLRSSSSITRWVRGSSDAAWEWRTWSHPSYSAYCRHFGNHRTAKVGARNWNEEAMASMNDDMEQHWAKFESEITDSMGEITALIEEEFEDVAVSLESEEFPGWDSDTFLEGIDSRQRILLSELEDVFTDFSSQLRILRTDGTSGIRTGIFGKLMERSYISAQHESGGGSDQRRKDTMEGRFSDVNLFLSWSAEFRKQCTEVCEELRQGVRQLIRTHVEVIRGTLDIIRNENTVLENERDSEFRGRIEEHLGWARSEFVRIKDVVVDS